MNQI
jgi:hypothetical protein